MSDREYVDPGFVPHENYCHLQDGIGGRCTCGGTEAFSKSQP